MIRFLFILSFVLQSYTAHAGLQICPRMPVATAVSNQFLTSISASGATTLAQPAFTNLSGSIATSQVNSGTNAGATTFFRGDNTWSAPTVTNFAPVVSSLTSGSGTFNLHYTFVITSGSATVGATYTNNAVTFTVYATVASATQVVMSGSGAPASSGTLTKASGTGDSTLTFSQVATPLYLRLRMVGGGGGGAGSGTSPGAAGDGGDSTFGSFTASHGTKAVTQSGGAGGTASGGDININGIQGQGGTGSATQFGGAGGGSYFAQGGSGGTPTGGGGQQGSTNTGAGGGGAGDGATAAAGAGGGGAAYIEKFISAPSATYSYAVGTAGSGGTAGTGTNPGPGGAGAAGRVVTEEHYQ